MAWGAREGEGASGMIEDRVPLVPGQVSFILGDLDPSSFGAAAPAGSIYLLRDASARSVRFFEKLADASPTAWRPRDAHARVFDVRNFGARGDGAADDMPAFVAAQEAMAAARGGVFLVPPGTYRLGDGYSETGSASGPSAMFRIFVSRSVYDFTSAVVVGCVVVGDPRNQRRNAGADAPADPTPPRDIWVVGGIFSPAPPPGPRGEARYAAVSNALGVVVGADVHFARNTCRTTHRTRALSIQTDTGWGIAPFHNVRRVTVSDLIVAGDGTTVDGIDITSAGGGALIADVAVSNAIVAGCLRGVHVSGYPGASVPEATVDRVSLSNVRVHGPRDVGLRVHAAEDVRVVGLSVTDTGWCGVELRDVASAELVGVDVRAANTLVAPPADAALPPESCGIVVRGRARGPVSVSQARVAGAFADGVRSAVPSARLSSVLVSGATVGLRAEGRRGLLEQFAFRDCGRAVAGDQAGVGSAAPAASFWEWRGAEMAWAPLAAAAESAAPFSQGAAGRPAITGRWSDGTALRSLVAALDRLGIVSDRTQP